MHTAWPNSLARACVIDVGFQANQQTRWLRLDGAGGWICCSDIDRLDCRRLRLVGVELPVRWRCRATCWAFRRCDLRRTIPTEHTTSEQAGNFSLLVRPELERGRLAGSDPSRPSHEAASRQAAAAGHKPTAAYYQ